MTSNRRMRRHARQARRAGMQPMMVINSSDPLPDPDDLVNRCELRVLDHDPHADAVPWHGPSVTSITQPIDLGPFEDAEPCRVLILRRHRHGG